ncbi:MAG: Crp/Fnr family transcriptional regulator [Proteobacteria bacterium]|nr:Crp/Fnr family transcriptional regulator [Pseudomonadota bacterium]
MKSLKNISIFSHLNEADMQAVRRAATTHVIKKNVRIFSEGDESNSMYVIQSGGVKVFNVVDRYQYVINDLDEGCYFGEYALLDDEKRSASVTTTSDSIILEIPKKAFTKPLENKMTSKLLINDLISRIRELSIKLIDTALLDVRTNIIRLLTNSIYSKKNGDGTFLTHDRWTHQQIADRLGKERETVSRVIRKLQKDRIYDIDKSSKCIIIDSNSLPKHYIWE